jgi:hypothetical protein
VPVPVLAGQRGRPGQARPARCMLPQVAGYMAAWLRQAARAGRYPAFRAKQGLPAVWSQEICR